MILKPNGIKIIGFTNEISYISKYKNTKNISLAKPVNKITANFAVYK